jgi:hypothetical protein
MENNGHVAGRFVIVRLERQARRVVANGVIVLPKIKEQVSSISILSQPIISELSVVESKQQLRTGY